MQIEVGGFYRTGNDALVFIDGSFDIETVVDRAPATVKIFRGIVKDYADGWFRFTWGEDGRYSPVVCHALDLVASC